MLYGLVIRTIGARPSKKVKAASPPVLSARLTDGAGALMLSCADVELVELSCAAPSCVALSWAVVLRRAVVLNRALELDMLVVLNRAL